MGVVIIPASVQLATKDIVYRVNAAGIRAIIATDDEWSQAQVEAAKPQCPDLEFLLLARGGKDGWIDYDQGIAQAKPEFTMPHIDNSDVMVCYFTSGTTGMPKLVVHDQTYPLGHIVTAKFWQRVEDGGPAPDRLRQRLGEVRLGLHLRPVDLGLRGAGVRHG